MTVDCGRTEDNRVLQAVHGMRDMQGEDAEDHTDRREHAFDEWERGIMVTSAL